MDALLSHESPPLGRVSNVVCREQRVVGRWFNSFVCLFGSHRLRELSNQLEAITTGRGLFLVNEQARHWPKNRRRDDGQERRQGMNEETVYCPLTIYTGRKMRVGVDQGKELFVALGIDIWNRDRGLQLGDDSAGRGAGLDTDIGQPGAVAVADVVVVVVVVRRTVAQPSPAGHFRYSRWPGLLKIQLRVGGGDASLPTCAEDVEDLVGGAGSLDGLGRLV